MGSKVVANSGGLAGASFSPTILVGKPQRVRKRWGIAYLSDPLVVNGAQILFDQKHAIDRYAGRQNIAVLRYVVDSGRPGAPSRLGHALRLLMDAVETGAVPVVLVEHVSRLAEDYAVALRLAAAFSSWGAEVHEAIGGCAILEPAVATVLFDITRHDASQGDTRTLRPPHEGALGRADISSGGRGC